MNGTKPSPQTHSGDNLSIPAAIFRAYDIRGIVDQELTPAAVSRICQAIGSEARSQDIQRLLVAYDGRLSSPSLSQAMITGLRASGIDVIDLGMVPTPLLYFATHQGLADSGVMLTASHNPANYNGLKIVLHRNCLAANQIQTIRERVERGELLQGKGDYRRLDIREDYMRDVCSRIKLVRPLRIVVDCGNAVAGIVAPELFRRLGCEVEPLFCEVDGNFPNHHPDPTVPENLKTLQQRVVESGADLGLAFDGDADRLGLVTDQGEAIAADRLLMLLAKSILPQYPQAPVVFDVKCSLALPRLIEGLGGRPVMHRSGHSFMKQKMQETGAPLGGEYAAHLFIKDRWYGFDDGLYAAARLLEIISGLDHPVSQEFTAVGDNLVSTPELKLPVAEQDKFPLMDSIIAAASFPDARIIHTDGLRVEYEDSWGLIRASNTSPALLMRFEAQSQQRLTQIKEEFKALIRTADNSIDLDF